MRREGIIDLRNVAFNRCSNGLRRDRSLALRIKSRCIGECIVPIREHPVVGEQMMLTVDCIHVRSICLRLDVIGNLLRRRNVFRIRRAVALLELRRVPRQRKCNIAPIALNDARCVRCVSLIRGEIDRRRI